MNKPYSSTILVFCGIILMGLGLYFVFLRPPLLPEDPRSMGAPLAEIQAIDANNISHLAKIVFTINKDEKNENHSC